MKNFYRMKIAKTEVAYVTVETDDPSKFTESDFTMEELYEAFDYSDWDLDILDWEEVDSCPQCGQCVGHDIHAH